MQAQVWEHWPNGREASQKTSTIYCGEHYYGPGKSKELWERREEQLTQLEGFVEVLEHELNHKG